MKMGRVRESYVIQNEPPAKIGKVGVGRGWRTEKQKLETAVNTEKGNPKNPGLNESWENDAEGGEEYFLLRCKAAVGGGR